MQSGIEPETELTLSSLTAATDTGSDGGFALRVIDAAPDGMVVVDEAGTIVLVNHQVGALFGYDRAELLGSSVELLVPDRFRAVHQTHRANYASTALPRAMGAKGLLFGRRRDGSEFPVEISLSPIGLESGLRIVAAVRDVTDRVEADAHARRVLQVLDATNDGVYVFDVANHRTVYVNQGAIAQVGYSGDELMAMGLSALTPDLADADLQALFAAVDRKAGSLMTRTAIFRSKNGRDVPVEIVIQALTLDDSEASPMVVAIARDISERLAAESREQERERELQILEDRERIARDLHDLVIQRLFAAGMSAQALYARLSDPALAERAAGIVDALDATISEIRTTIFGLQHPIRSNGGFRERMMAVIEEQRVHLGFAPHVHFEGALEAVSETMIDSALAILREALSNVARHAGASNVEISILAHDELVLRVLDDGVGVHLEPSTGSGIANMAERARALGGSFELRPRAEGGTQLECRLPHAAE